VAENGEGQPVPFANVILRIPAVERRAGVSSVEVLGAIRAVIASESGQWEMESVPPGLYQVDVQHPSYATSSSIVSIPDTGRVELPTSLAPAYSGSVIPPCSRTGVVCDGSSCRPLAGVTVSSWVADAVVLDLRTPPEYRCTQTDSTGTYQISSWKKTRVMFTRQGFESLVLYWPDDLREDCESCCRRLCDSYMMPVGSRVSN
jgi:protocatechuate 3,4-dioxygenase beta subunit